MWAPASRNMAVDYPVPWQETFTQSSLILFTAAEAGSLIIKKRVTVMVLLWD